MISCTNIIARGFATSTAFQSAIKNVTVVGGGLMGAGIGQVAAQTGHNVTIVEVNDEAIQKAKNNVEGSIQKVAKKIYKDNSAQGEKFVAETLKRLKLTTDLHSAAKQSDLVIEAIVENMDAKHKLFSAIDPIAPPETIFASNTSSLSIRDIASVVKRKDKFCGLHFFNPVPVMKLLEVVRTSETSDDTYNKAIEWGKSIGKVTITCKDTPGFVVNRLLIPFLAEAFLMLERGDATARDIDTAMKLGAGHPMGPFELADYVGHDTTYFILKGCRGNHSHLAGPEITECVLGFLSHGFGQTLGWQEKFPDNPTFKTTAIIEKLVKEGKLGVKTGEGIYNYKK